MKLALAAIITLAAALVNAALDCTPFKFGEMKLEPVRVKPGDNMTVTANHTCAIKHGIKPLFVDSYLMALDSAGQFKHEYFMFLSHQKFDTNNPVHTFNARLPVRQYLNVTILGKAEIIYTAKDESGMPYLAIGETRAPVILE